MTARRNSFRPGLESLETRYQLSAAVTTAPAPILVANMVHDAMITQPRTAGHSDALSLATQEQQIFVAANRFRSQNRVAALKINATLRRVAEAHAANMARQEKLDHVLNGQNPADRVLKAGYRFSVVAENIAYSTALNINAIMQGWFHSPGHRRNLLLRSVVETGIGAARSRAGNWYYCQVFASPLRF